MKQFLNKILFFLIPVFIIGYGLDIFLSHILKKDHSLSGEYEVWNDIYSGKLNTNIAIYGSSRAFIHYNTELLEDSLKTKVYNFGINGNNFILQYLRHKEYLKHNTQPDIIIMSVDMFTLQKGESFYNASQLLPYMLWNKNMFTYAKFYKAYNSFEYFIPLIRYYGKKNDFIKIVNILLHGESDTKHRNKGFKPQHLEWNDDFSQAKRKLGVYKVNINPFSITIFEDFIEECISKNIKLILVYTPEYLAGQYFVTNRAEVMQIYKDYAKKYDLNFIDFSDDELSKNRKYFYNASHLNAQGADIFSQKLAKKLLTP